MKRLSVFFVFIFLFSILSVNYPYRENSIFQDDSLILNAFDDNSDFLTCDIYQILLNYRFIDTIIVVKNLFTPRILTCKFFTRAPPV
jgi:hypothetical protein